MDFTEGCSICGDELVYTQATGNKPCSICGETGESNVDCPQHHFVCDSCHRSSAIQLIERYCNSSDLNDPMEMAVFLMKNPIISMHGPEHHYLVPAVLLTAYFNKDKQDHIKKHKLAIARKRAETVPGGYCGTHGTCGAAIGTGIFISIITNSTPLAEKEWMLSNKMTSTTLLKIAEEGGPRCCKRDSFTSIKTAVDYLKTEMDVELPLSSVVCEFSHRNKQCKFDNCQYFDS